MGVPGSEQPGITELASGRVASSNRATDQEAIKKAYENGMGKPDTKDVPITTTEAPPPIPEEGFITAQKTINETVNPPTSSTVPGESADTIAAESLEKASGPAETTPLPIASEPAAAIEEALEKPEITLQDDAQAKINAIKPEDIAAILNNPGVNAAAESIKTEETKEEAPKSNQELYKKFKEIIEKNNIRYVKIGNVLILPAAVPATDTSRQIIIGFDEKTGPIQFDAGINNSFEKIIQSRVKVSPEGQKEITDAINNSNKNKLPERQLQEGLREVAGAKQDSEKQYELLIWDKIWFRPLPVKISPEETLIDTAIEQSKDFSTRLTEEEKKWQEAKQKQQEYHKDVAEVLTKYNL